jgi:quercetin dioxygenase-like cupin family protein
MKVTVIQGNGYTKYLFNELDLSGNEEFSYFEWDNGESPAHDHSVDEITYVLDGTMTEIRKVNDLYVATSYGKGTQFEVPAGTEHVVKTKGQARTVNFCKGKLAMNILKDFLPKDVEAA